MATVKRLYYRNALYHICIRGNNRQYILEQEEDKIAFLDSLEKFRARFGFKLFAFVIMDNHAHLVIQTNNLTTISKIMHAITLSYSVKFRKKYGYTGYVWQGRFKSKVIEGQQHILECINYMHNNPIRAGIVEKIEDYPWSSYHFYQGLSSNIKDHLQIEKFE